MRPCDRVVCVLDMDGVLVDSLPALREAYARFLERHDRSPSDAEFATLNGPSLPEIVRRLRASHALAFSEAELLERYRQELVRVYARPTLMPGADRVLELLDLWGVPAALASSAPRSCVEPTLRALGLARRFELVVTGDEVERAKPDPEIYTKVRRGMPADRYVVLEDSLHGLSAARAAGMLAVRVERGEREIVLEDSHRESDRRGTERPWEDLDESESPDLRSALARLIFGYRILSRARPVRVILGDAPAIDPERSREIDAVWCRERGRRAELFDGEVLCLAAATGAPLGRGARATEDPLRLSAHVRRYREVFARLQGAEIASVGWPLGVSARVVNARGEWLLGRRCHTTEYPGVWELAPSGGVPAPASRGEVDLLAALLRELEEETGLTRAHLRRVSPVGVVLDAVHAVVDVAWSLLVDADGGSGALEGPGKPTREYDPLCWIAPEALGQRDFARPVVPVSAALLEL